MSLLRCAIFFTLLVNCCWGWTISSKGSVLVSFPYSSSVLENADGTHDVTISQFDPVPRTKDQVLVVRDVGKQLSRLGGGFALKTEVLIDNIRAPNEVGVVPGDVLDRDDLWWVSSGYPEITKKSGFVSVIESKAELGVNLTAPTYDITSLALSLQDRRIYNRVQFVQSLDLHPGAMTSRFHIALDGNMTCEMVWLKNPLLGDPLSEWFAWEETVLFSGPDVYFSYAEYNLTYEIRNSTLSGIKRFVIVSTQFFSNKLVVSWVDGLPDFKKLKHRVIASDPNERFYDSQIIDLNGDGNLDILVSCSNHENGKLIAYESPLSWERGIWRKHVIHDGFAPPGLGLLESMGSPGSPLALFPSINENRKKPMIFLSGKDDGKVYAFEAVDDDDSTNWSYSNHTIYTSPLGSVGKISAADVTGDGDIEIFIPAYAAGMFNTYSYNHRGISLPPFP